MLVYKKIESRLAIKETGLKEASHYCVIGSGLSSLAEAELIDGLSYIIEQVHAGTDPVNEPALFNVYKIVSCEGYADDNLVFLKKVGYSNGEKVVEYKANWTEEDVKQISVTTTKTVAITDLE